MDMPNIGEVVWTFPVPRGGGVAVKVESMEEQDPEHPGRGSTTGTIIANYNKDRSQFEVGKTYTVRNCEISKVESEDRFLWRKNITSTFKKGQTFYECLDAIKAVRPPAEIAILLDRMAHCFADRAQVHLARPTKRGIFLVVEHDDRYALLRCKDDEVVQYAPGNLFFAAFTNENLACLGIRWVQSQGGGIPVPIQEWKFDPKSTIDPDSYSGG